MPLAFLLHKINNLYMKFMNKMGEIWVGIDKHNIILFLNIYTNC